MRYIFVKSMCVCTCVCVCICLCVRARARVHAHACESQAVCMCSEGKHAEVTPRLVIETPKTRREHAACLDNESCGMYFRALNAYSQTGETLHIKGRLIFLIKTDTSEIPEMGEGLNLDNYQQTSSRTLPFPSLVHPRTAKRCVLIKPPPPF